MALFKTIFTAGAKNIGALLGHAGDAIATGSGPTDVYPSPLASLKQTIGDARDILASGTRILGFAFDNVAQRAETGTSAGKNTVQFGLDVVQAALEIPAMTLSRINCASESAPLCAKKIADVFYHAKTSLHRDRSIRNALENVEWVALATADVAVNKSRNAFYQFRAKRNL